MCVHVYVCVHVYIIICTHVRRDLFVNEYGCMYIPYFITIIYFFCLVIVYIEVYTEDEYHMIMICEHFRDVRVKYIKPFYYKRPSMWKFVQLMNSTSKRDRFKLMLFLKIIFKLYGDTL